MLFGIEIMLVTLQKDRLPTQLNLIFNHVVLHDAIFPFTASASSIVFEPQLESSNIVWHVKSLSNYRYSEVQVLHLLPNESD